MVAYLFRMPAGIPGEVSRSDNLLIEPQTIQHAGATGAPTAYGIPLIMDASSKRMRAIQANELASAIYGFLVRPYPTNSSNEGLGVAAPNITAGAACDVLRRGYMNVRLARGNASKGDPVFVRRVADTGKLVGELEAALDNTVASAAKSGGNTGNGTLGTLSATAAALNGVYQVRFTAATIFNVIAPDGRLLAPGATGAAYAGGEVVFTITAGGTPFVAGDGFDITVVQRTQPIPGAFFTGAADSNGNVEVGYRI